MEWKFHIPYHPQSSRMNRTLKERITKASLDENKSWIDLLPAILAEIRMTPNATTKMSPFEVLMGHFQLLGCVGGVVHVLLGKWTLFCVIIPMRLFGHWMASMVMSLSSPFSLACVSLPPLCTFLYPLVNPHLFQPGDQVLNPREVGDARYSQPVEINCKGGLSA